MFIDSTSNIVSQSFTINGNPATVFSPAVVGPGTHTVTYTVDGGVPKAFNPTDPGCIQSVSQSVVVFPAVDGTISGGNTAICAGLSSNVNINLSGTPNFTGHFKITVINGV